MDRITLTGIEVWARHGVLEHERVLGQRFLVDVTLEADLAAAAASDHLADTLDYGAVARRVHDTVAGTPRDLIETVAALVLDALLEDDRVTAAEVVVHKPQAPMPVPVQDVAVRMRRERPA